MAAHQAIKLGRFRSANRTPASPEDYDRGMSTEIFKRNSLTTYLLQMKFGRSVTNARSRLLRRLLVSGC
jgi:hypothetical protein